MDMSIEGQGHFLTLAKGHLHLKIKTGFSQNDWAILNQVLFCAWTKYQVIVFTGPLVLWFTM